MNLYLKYKPVWYRVMVMGVLIPVVMIIFSLLSYIIASQLSGFSFQQLVSPDMNDHKMMEVQKWLLLTNSAVAVFLIPSLLYAYFADSRPFHFLRLDIKPTVWYLLIAVVIMIVVVPSTFWIGELNKKMDISPVLPGLNNWIKKTEADTNQLLEKIISGHNISDLFRNLLLVALLPAIGEELMFRGLLQKGLIRVTRNVWMGILLSAFIFSAAHLQFLTFLSRFELGIILGALFWYSGSIWVSITAHFIFNGLQVFLEYYLPDAQETSPALLSAKMVGISFLLVIVLMIIIKRHSTVTMSEVYDDEDDDDFIIEQDNRQMN